MLVNHHEAGQYRVSGKLDNLGTLRDRDLIPRADGGDTTIADQDRLIGSRRRPVPSMIEAPTRATTGALTET